MDLLFQNSNLHFVFITRKTRNIVKLTDTDTWEFFSRQAFVVKQVTTSGMFFKTIGVITPNQNPLTTIVTYLQKGYRSRI